MNPVRDQSLVHTQQKQKFPISNGMKISIIIATYNDPAIEQCLNSIFESRNVDFETIVVDDGSTSINLKKITEKYPKCKTFTFTKNKGPATARNFGAEQATGDILFFIDSDAQVYSDTLQKISKRFTDNPNIQGVTVTWSDESIKTNFLNKFKAIETNYIFNNFFTKSFGSNGSAIYKKIFLAEGGFDENFKTAHAEDFYLGLKLFGKNYNIILDKNILMKNSYLDRFFWGGFKKYCKRAFLRAVVLYQIKNKKEASYNSKKFKILYLLSALIFILLISGLALKPLLWTAFALYTIFFYLNMGLYSKFYKKHGFVFLIRSIIMHYFIFYLYQFQELLV